MTRYEDLIAQPPVQAAIAELQELIRRQYPAATFTVGPAEEPEGIYLRAIIDVADLDEVEETFLDRLVDLQVEHGLPIYVVPVRPSYRVTQLVRAIRSGQSAVAIVGD